MAGRNRSSAPSANGHEPATRSRPIHLWLLAVLLLLAWGLWLHALDSESLWRDEVDSIRFAGEIWQTLASPSNIQTQANQLAAYLTRPGWNGPLYFVTLGGWLRASGSSELALRLPSALAGLASIALAFQLGSELLNRTAGALTALLMSANPYLAWYAGEAKMYTLITTLALLSTLLLVRACVGGRRRYWVGYVLTTTILFYTHILTPLLLPVQLGTVLLRHPGAIRSRAAWLSAAALTLPYLPLLAWQWPHLRQPAETGFPFVPLPAMTQRLAEVFSRGIIGWPAAVPLVLLMGALCLGVLYGRGRISLALLWWMVAPLLALYLISLRRPLFTERYLIWTLPAWLTLAAGGLAALARRPGARRWLATCWTAGLVLCGLLGIVQQWRTPVRADFRAATHYVRDHYQAGELVLFQIPYLQATFDYYAPSLAYSAAEGPYTNRNASEVEVDDYMRHATAGHPTVWLVLSEAPMWDARGLTQRWLQDNSVNLVEKEFNRVTISRWQLPNDRY